MLKTARTAIIVATTVVGITAAVLLASSFSASATTD